MSEEEAYEGIRNCTFLDSTFLDTEITGELKEDFAIRLKKETKEKK